jgi:hypothetical protein
MPRPDPLAGLTGAQRLRKEQEDGEYAISHPEMVAFVEPEALKLADNTYAGTMLDPKRFQPYNKERVDAVICARHDLEHPLYFPDNSFGNCKDCGCDLQYRPFVPRRAPKFCISCIARRLREGKTFRKNR